MWPMLQSLPPLKGSDPEAFRPASDVETFVTQHGGGRMGVRILPLGGAID